MDIITNYHTIINIMINKGITINIMRRKNYIIGYAYIYI